MYICVCVSVGEKEREISSTYLNLVTSKIVRIYLRIEENCPLIGKPSIR